MDTVDLLKRIDGLHPRGSCDGCPSCWIELDLYPAVNELIQALKALQPYTHLHNCRMGRMGGCQGCKDMTRAREALHRTGAQ